MSETYLEKCVQALPPEKQAAARAAFRDISETGGDNVFSKVLVTLEATGAYAAKIPQEVTARGERLLHELDARVTRLAQEQAEAETQREERLHKLITSQVPQLGKTLALDQVVAGQAALAAAVGRIERGQTLLRRARVGGMVFFMLLGAGLSILAVVGLGWPRYHEWQQAVYFVDRLNAAGISARIQKTDAGERLMIEGPEALRGTTWKKDSKGHIYGVELIYPTQEGR